MFTLMFTVMFSSPSYAEWTKVTESVHGDAFYIDFERVRKHDGYVYYWLLSDYSKPLGVSKLLSSKRYHQVDCKSFGYKVLSYVYHKEKMGRDNGEAAEPVDKSWKYPSPGTSDESLIELIC